MPKEFRLPQTLVHLGQGAMQKLSRTEAGRAILNSEQCIADSVKFEKGRPDRVWLGTTSTSVLHAQKYMTLRCAMSQDVLVMMQKAVAEKDAACLGALGLKLVQAFQGGANYCPFILEEIADEPLGGD